MGQAITTTMFSLSGPRAALSRARRGQSFGRAARRLRILSSHERRVRARAEICSRRLRVGQTGQGALSALPVGALYGHSLLGAVRLRVAQDFLVEQERKALKRSVSKDDDGAGLASSFSSHAAYDGACRADEEAPERFELGDIIETVCLQSAARLLPFLGAPRSALECWRSSHVEYRSGHHDEETRAATAAIFLQLAAVFDPALSSMSVPLLSLSVRPLMNRW